VIQEQDGDPFAVMMPTTEIIRFYYAPSTRLAQALFWGEYGETFNAERSGVLEEGVVRVHLRQWMEDQDAWTLARYMCSPVMQCETSRLYSGLQLYQLNSPNVISGPNQNLPCGFPFEGSTTVQGICLPLPGPTSNSPPRWLILRIERCSAPFPFDQVIVDRDNNSIPGENNEDENLIPAWAKDENNRQKVEKQAPDTFRSNEEPRRGLDPLRIDLIEDRFEGLKGKKLVKEEKTVQRFRHSPLKVAANQMLTGLGTGQGTWGTSSLQLTKLTTVQSREPKRRDVLVLPASMETFVLAIELLAEKHAPCEVAFIGTGERDTTFGAHTLASFPTHEPHRERKSGGPGSKERIAQGASPLPRFAPKTRSHTRSKSSEPIRSTQFSSWLVTTFRESVPANCKHSCCCALSGVGGSRKIKCRATGARPRPIAN